MDAYFRGGTYQKASAFQRQLVLSGGQENIIQTVKYSQTLSSRNISMTLIVYLLWSVGLQVYSIKLSLLKYKHHCLNDQLHKSMSIRESNV